MGSATASSPANLPSTPTKSTVFAVGLKGRRPGLEGRVRRHALLRKELPCLPTATGLPSTTPATPPPVTERNPGPAGPRAMPLSSAPRTTAPPGDVPRHVPSDAASRSSHGSPTPGGSDVLEPGLPLREGPGLVEDQPCHLAEALEGLGVLEEHAALGAPAHPHHDGHGRGQPQRAGTGDDEDGDRVDDGVGQAGLGPKRNHARKVSAAAAATVGTKNPATLSATPWIGARLRCALATICTMRESSESAPPCPPQDEASGGVDRAARHGSPAFFSTGSDSPVIIDSSTRRSPPRSPRRRGPCRRPHPRRSPTWTSESGTSRLALVRYTDRGGRGQVEERPDRARGLRAGAQLEHLAEKHEHNDDRGGLEIDLHHAVHAHGRGENPGQEERDRAVGPGRADPERDQGEHVPVGRCAASGRRERRTASRPTTPPASKGGTGPTG
jgi:hypothetical protein